jgi:hypothetical protein
MVLARLKRQIEIGTEETRRRVRLIGSLSVSAGCRQIVRLDIAHLTAADLTRFVVRERQRRPLSPARVLVPALRSFLRFLYIDGCAALPEAVGFTQVRAKHMGSRVPPRAAS